MSLGKNRIKRSFDRTFVLSPSVPGSRAAQAGIPYTILNDQLVLRCFTNNWEWDKAEALSASSSLLDSLVGCFNCLLNPANPLQNPTQKSLVESFSLSTGLNYEFSLQCLSEMNWDVQQASAAFQTAKVVFSVLCKYVIINRIHMPCVVEHP
jgi:nuclear RNA export factor